MKQIKVFQIKEDKQNRLFASTRQLQRLGLQIEPKYYHKVYEGQMDVNNAEDVYVRLQGTKPNGYKGHSLSVSDIVSIDGKYFFCDSFGFKDVTQNFNLV